MSNEVERILGTIAGSPVRTCGDHLVYSPGPLNKAQVDAIISRIESGKIAVVDLSKMEFVRGRRCPPTMRRQECPAAGCLECKMAYLRGDNGEETDNE